MNSILTHEFEPILDTIQTLLARIYEIIQSADVGKIGDICEFASPPSLSYFNRRRAELTSAEFQWICILIPAHTQATQNFLELLLGTKTILLFQIFIFFRLTMQTKVTIEMVNTYKV